MKGFVSRRSSGVIAVLVIVALTLQACSSIPPRTAVPEDMLDKAVVPGGTVARMWGDAAPSDIESRVALIAGQMATRGREEAFTEAVYYLAISGGGANGAFGAGFLKGWTVSGTRPEMTIVTGISTGALIAPFAFLGSDYDDELGDLYTTITTSDLIKKRSIFKLLTTDALADTAPMRELLKEYIDDVMIRRIAEEYAKGRRLLIGTTNLDAKRPVIWNIGAIAEVGTEESAQLIRDVMLASASIPALFPPIRIKVRVGEEVYDELHVDGGVASQVFLYPANLDLRESALAIGYEGKQTLYIIRNGMLEPSWNEVKQKLGPVTKASISTLIRTQGMGDLYRMYLGTKRDDIRFRLAYVPYEFDVESDEAFDSKYMKALFDFAYELSSKGYDWATSPPGVALP